MSSSDSPVDETMQQASYPKKDQSLGHQSIHNSITPSIIPLVNRPITPSIDDITASSDSKAGRVYLFGSDLAGIKQSLKHSASQSNNQSTQPNDSTSKDVTQSANSTINQSIDQSVTQPIDDSDDSLIAPTLVQSLLSYNCSSLSLSASHGAVITDDGKLMMFGSNDRGELGQTTEQSSEQSNDQSFNQSVYHSSSSSVHPPTVVPSLSDSFIVQCSTGLNHTAAITSRGNLYVWGAHEFGQLGIGNHSSNQSKQSNEDYDDHSVPVQVKNLPNIVKVCCGDSHTLALGENGVVYAAGDAKRGATGIDINPVTKQPTSQQDSSRIATFTPITALMPLPIVDIAVGSHHSLALTMGGFVYSFGASRRGQTGLGSSDNVRAPKLIESLRDVRIVRVFAGGDASAALSENGKLYVFGANQHGQLGIGDRDSRFAPVRLTDGLEDKLVVKVGFGLNHMLIMCDDHTVLGCGDSSLGQLGLSCSEDSDEQDYKRQKTGDADEMALVPATDNLSVSGRGDVLIPTQVPLPHGRIVMDIAAGSTSSGVIISAHAAVMLSPIAIPSSHQSIKHIIPETFHALVESCRAESSYVPLIIYINKHFSSMQSLNASFLPVINPVVAIEQGRLMRQASLTNQDPLALAIATPAALMPEAIRRNHVPTALPGSIDVMAVEEVYKSILRESVSESKLLQALTHSMQKCIHELVTRLKSSHPPSDSEAYRGIAICLQSPLFSQAAATDVELLSDIAHCVDRLSITCRKALRRWWSLYPSEIFGARLVRTVVHAVHTQLKEAKLHNIEQRVDGAVIMQARLRRVSDQVQMMVKLLDLMHQASELASPGVGLLDAKHWHIDLGDLVALDDDFIAFARPPATEAQVPEFSFLRYPYVLDAATKAAYMHIEHMYYQRHSMMQALAFEQQPYTVLKIKRDSLVESAIYQINSFRIDELQRPLKVQFIGEEGVDQGGVSTEFFRLVVKELMSPQYELFDYDEERRQLWYNLTDVSDNPSKVDLYYITGLLIGLACYNVCLLEGVNFPMALYKSLLHSSKQSITFTLEDLFSLDPQLTRSLQHILSYDGNDMEEVFDLNFTTSHPVHKGDEIEIRTVELIPNGSNIMVTQANKQQYVHAVIQQHLYGSVKAQSQAFMKGFRSVCSGRVLSMFTPSDLEAMCVGSPVLDFSLLKTRARYEGFRPDSPVVQWLWEILNEMSLEEKQKFLTFVTGSSRVGIGGLSAIVIIIQRAGPDSESWPTASTCFSILLLNEYSSKEKLKSKLLAAIQHTEGFGLQ